MKRTIQFLLRMVPISLVLVAFVAGFIAYPHLPDQMSTHWNIQGEADGSMGKFWGTFFAPVVMLIMYAVFLIIPRIDQKKENIRQFRRDFDLFIVTMLVFFLYLYGLVLAWNFGYRFDFVRLLVPTLAGLFYIIGHVVGRAKQNWTIGIRTPWTLSSESVWKKTHALGGRLFKLDAIIMLGGALVPRYAFWILFVPLVATTVFLVGYSYVIYTRERR